MKANQIENSADRMKIARGCVLAVIALGMQQVGCSKSGSPSVPLTATNSATPPGGNPQPVPNQNSMDLTFLRQCLDHTNALAGCPEVKQEAVAEQFSAPPTDILFVLDESCSMSSIANNVRQGFASLQGTVYPENTKMAVTYMSPVKQDSEGNFDFNTPYHSPGLSVLPGHLKLVSKSTIENYVSAVPGNAGAFPLQGCSDEWFAPGDKNAQGQPCLSAAVQLANVCTGIEAGLVSTEQLAMKMYLSGKRLFRPNAVVNIIFVSDTHEPGDSYFGRIGAPARIRDAEEFISLMYNTNPGISSIKLAGILPVPIVGDPLLDGLKVIGAVPTTPAEAKVGDEHFWNYSYLPLIKSFRGAVAHAKTNNWTGVAQSLIDDSKYAGSAFVPLTHAAKRVFYVVVNDVTLTTSQYTLHSDHMGVTVRHSNPTNAPVNIEIIYE